MKRACLLTLTLAGLLASGSGRCADAPPPTRPGQSVTDLAFLAGTWVGSMDGDRLEETWSAPAHDSVIGMFRWQTAADDRPAPETTLWELLAITREERGLTLRLRHFGKELMPWKSEQGEPGIAPLRATTLERDRAVFTNTTDAGGLASIEYSRPNEETLRIVISFKDPARRPLHFELKRQPSGAK